MIFHFDMRVLCAGSFDIIHVGHLNLLMHCRVLAGHKGEVLVSLDSDNKITRDKGRDRPIFECIERVNAIESLKIENTKIVDKTFIHESNDYLLELIKTISPDLIVVGSDYQDKKVIGSEYAEVKYFPRDWRFSSTKIIEACQKQKC